MSRLYPTFKEWKPVKSLLRFVKDKVYILPLRNENIYEKDKWVDTPSRLYPTFKEWKHKSSYQVCKEMIGLYPTFKEWKPDREF